MIDNLNHALSCYALNVKNIENLNHNGSYKLTDDKNKKYFLKIYGKNNDDDIIPGERVYHTYEQLQIESEILNILSKSVMKTAAPLKNINGGFVTVLEPDANGENIYATVTSFIDGTVKKNPETPTKEMAYISGASAAQLHIESKKNLLPLAVKRPHKRQDYIKKIREVLSRGINTGSLTKTQYKMLGECCDAIINCMNELDKDFENNVGLVHTDIRSSNIIYNQNHGTLIDFSRCVYSYYLYDVAEMCLHGDFGGSSRDLQKEILRGYNSVKPLNKEHLFAVQVLFAMFILMLMAYFIENKENAWLINVLKWFADEVHPGLVSGKGYLDISYFEDIFII